ncbi:DUF3054 domain-containing protein [Haloarcula salina]|uniref:DUF3054 domain-containing protein n=1 Tax=Haloarcula salina TaxID=1429914 RepID=UPI003C6FE827
MSVSTVGNGRVELSGRTALLAVGDLLAIGVFVAVGEFTHGINPFLNPGRFAGTLTPFLVGWALVAAIGGLYTSDGIGTFRAAVAKTFVGWILAVGIAQALRATELFPGNAALTFALVSVLVGGTLLVCWRSVAATLLHR